MPDPTRDPPPGRLTAVLFARATGAEKRCITARAQAAGLSVSRYLVKAALEGRPPATREERARLEALLFVLKRATLAVGTLRANLSGLRLAGATPGIREDLEETEAVLKRLAAGIGGRL